MPGTQTFVDGDATGWQNVASVVAILPNNIVLWPMTRPLFAVQLGRSGAARGPGYLLSTHVAVAAAPQKRWDDDSRYAEC